MFRNCFFEVKDEKNPNTVFQLHVEWHSEGCHIFVVTGNACYQGKITNEEIKIQSELLGMPLEGYVQECKESLSSITNTGNFFYQLENDLFVVRKSLQTKTRMKVKMATFKLEQMDTQRAIYTIFEKAMKQTEKLIAEIDYLKKENKAIYQNYEIAVQRLDEMTQTKNHGEKILYNRFLSLLNSKKKKLAQLQNQNDSMSENEKDMESAMDKLSSDDSAYNVETDVDEEDMKDELLEELRIQSNKISPKEPVPGTSSMPCEYFTKSIDTNKKSKIDAITSTIDFQDSTIRSHEELVPGIDNARRESSTKFDNMSEESNIKTVICSMDFIDSTISSSNEPVPGNSSALHECSTKSDCTKKQSQIGATMSAMDFLDPTLSTSKEFLPVISSALREYSTKSDDTNKQSRIEAIMNTMDFLDPTIPFKRS